MQMTIREGDLLQDAVPLAVLALYEDEPLPTAVAELIEADDFKGKAKQTLLLYPRGAVAARRLLLIGLGKRNAASADTLRQLGATSAQRARELSAATLALNLPVVEGLDPAAAAQAVAEGAEMGLYRYVRYKSDAEAAFEVANLHVYSGSANEATQQGLEVGQAVAHGVRFARDLANGPGNDVTPTYLAQAAADLAERYGFAATILDQAQLIEQGFGGIVAVGQGSAQEPRFIALEHGTKQAGQPTVCLVGKGITFDTGGISIKPADKMDDMKMDMGGAAAVLGTMHVVGELKLPLHVVGIVCAAENMPSSTAYKPGDIIKTLSGKTVEVLNTDAEGRIVLADGLFYAQRYQPTAIIDLATLTGAIMVALGGATSGLIGNNQELADRVVQAGTTSAERAWQLPLWDDYREMMKSDIADLKNTGGRYGGAISAAAFLEAFVGEFPWVHLDIAGVAWVERPTRSYHAKGATGFGVRLLTQLLRDYL
jgi:leucyl aminopeptidase